MVSTKYLVIIEFRLSCQKGERTGGKLEERRVFKSHSPQCHPMSVIAGIVLRSVPMFYDFSDNCAPEAAHIGILDESPGDQFLPAGASHCHPSHAPPSRRELDLLDSEGRTVITVHDYAAPTPNRSPGDVCSVDCCEDKSIKLG